MMLADVLTHNLNHTEIIDCGLANGTEVIVIFELSSTIAQKLEKVWAASHPHQDRHVLPQDGDNFGIGAILNGRFNGWRFSTPSSWFQALKSSLNTCASLPRIPCCPWSLPVSECGIFSWKTLSAECVMSKEGQVARFWSWAI